MRVWDRVRKANEFVIPVSSSPTPDGPSTPVNHKPSQPEVLDLIEKRTPIRSAKKRSAAQMPIEASDDEEDEPFRPRPKRRAHLLAVHQAKSSISSKPPISSDDELSSKPELDDEAETGSEDSTDPGRNVKFSTPSPGGRRGNQNDWGLKNEVKTKATPWMNRLASLRARKLDWENI